MLAICAKADDAIEMFSTLQIDIGARADSISQGDLPMLGTFTTCQLSSIVQSNADSVDGSKEI